MSQPFPSYYLTRPDHVQIPLIPLDELPHWIEIGAWNWSDTSLFETMDPVSCDCIPRSGEYEVLCHYCAASVDKLHRSVSQQSPPGIPTPRTQSTNTTTVRRPASYTAESSKQPCSSLVAQGILPAVAPFLQRPTLTQPAFHASLRAPFVGMCLLDCDSQMYARWRKWRREREERAGGETGVNLANLQDKFLARKGSKTEGSDRKPETSGSRPEASGQKLEGSGQQPEGLGLKPETSDRNSKGSGQELEGSGSGPEEPGPKPNAGQKPEEPVPKPNAGQKPEEPVPKPETGLKPENPDPTPETSPKQVESGQQPQEPVPVPPLPDQYLRPRSRDSGGHEVNPWEVRFDGTASPDRQKGLTVGQISLSTYPSGSAGDPGARRIYWPLVDRYCKGLLAGGQESHPDTQGGPSGPQEESSPQNQSVTHDGQIQYVHGLRYSDLESRQPESDQESESSTSSANGPLSPLSIMVNTMNSLLYPGQRRNPPLESVRTIQDGTPDNRVTSADSTPRHDPTESTEVALPQLRLPSPVAPVDFDPWAFDCLTPGSDSDAAALSRGGGLPKSRVSVLSTETRSRGGKTRDSVGSLCSWQTITTEDSMGGEDGTNKTQEAHGDTNLFSDWDTYSTEWLRNECRVFGLGPVDSRGSGEGDRDAVREAETTFLPYWGSSNPEDLVKGDQSQNKSDEAHNRFGASTYATVPNKRDHEDMNEHEMTGIQKGVLKAQRPFLPLQNPKPVHGILRTGPGEPESREPAREL